MLTGNSKSMRSLKAMSIFLFALGTSFIVVSAINGELSMGFILFFPFIYGKGFYATIGFTLMFISIFLFIISLFDFEKQDTFYYREKQVEPDENKHVEGGGVLLIGPFPIVVGSNWKIIMFLLIVAFIIITAVFFLNLTFAK